MNPSSKKVLKGVLYPTFYFVAFSGFVLLSFPYDRLRDRLVAEFNARQPAGAGARLEIDKMSGYWVSGVEAQGVKLHAAAPPPKADGKAEEGRVVTVDDIHLRVSLLKLVFGTFQVTFGGEAFGGSLGGSISDADGVRSIVIELDGVNVGDLPLMREVVGLPLEGKLSGNIDLRMPEAKLSKADGKVSLKIVELAFGDGKAKIRDTIALPRVEAGELELVAEATEGRLKVEKLAANGSDIELAADGSIRLREPLDMSLAELSFRFKFADKLKTKNDTTKALFGEPGSSVPGLFDLDPKNKTAKRPDGFYAYRLTGPLGKLDAVPAPLGSAAGGAGAGAGKGARGFSGTR
ncbi:MAG: type II secretion system protein GspN [Polyangiaceae bacterium]|nr:type II secretion system protein GspN [Polyangiaceae bacterium]